MGTERSFYFIGGQRDLDSKKHENYCGAYTRLKGLFDFD
jgi:hypothetical protein